MLHSTNTELASPCQTIGIRVGMFIGTSVFLTLNSQSFAESYLGRETELLGVPGFL